MNKIITEHGNNNSHLLIILDFRVKMSPNESDVPITKPYKVHEIHNCLDCVCISLQGQ